MTHFAVIGGANSPSFQCKSYHSTCFRLRKVLLFKVVPASAVQPYPEQPSNLQNYPLKLSGVLFPSLFDTLITQTIHAAHTLHIKKTVQFLIKTAFLKGKNCITVTDKLKKRFYEENRTMFAAQMKKNCYVAYFFLSLN